MSTRAIRSQLLRAARLSSLLVALAGLVPALAAASEAALSWQQVIENPYSFRTPGMAAGGANRVLYLFSGAADPLAPAPSSRVYRQDLDTPHVDWQLASSAGVPSPGFSHVFFDRSRQRLFVLGGWGANGTSSRIWSWDPATDQWEEHLPAHAGPDTVWALQPMVHDARRNRLLFFGSGFDAVMETWALDLAAEEPDWSLLATTTPPPFTFQATAAYDSLGDRVLFFGGQRPGMGFNGEIRRLDLATGVWTLLPDEPPVGSSPPRAFWDAVTDRFFVHAPATGPGGYENTVLYSISFDALPTWQAVPAAGSLPLLNTTIPWAYDPVAGELHLADHAQPTPVLATLSTRPTRAWSTRYLEGRSTAGTNAAHAVDATGRAWYVHVDEVLWRIDLDNPAAQQVVLPTGTASEARSRHSAVADTAANRLVYHGGVDSLGQPLTDTWALELGPPLHWAPIETDGPGPIHVSEPSALDVARRDLYVISGTDLWRLDLSATPASWQWVAALPFNPEAIAFDALSRRLLAVSRHEGLAVEVDALPVTILPPVPQARSWGFGGAAHAYDSRRRQLMIHNGIWGSSNSGNVYRLLTDAFRASADPVFVDLGVVNPEGTPLTGSLATYDPVRDRMVLMNGSILGLWTLQFDETTPARLDLVDAVADAGAGGAPPAIHVRFAGEGPSGEVRVERAAGGTAADDWRDIGAAAETTPGLYAFTDRDIVRGVAYRYRGRWFVDGVEKVTSASAPITVPVDAGSAVLALRPRGGSVVRAWPLELDIALVPGAGAATLELVDVRGRVIARQRVEAAGVLRVAPAQVPGAGLYFLRVRQGTATAQARVVLL